MYFEVFTQTKEGGLKKYTPPKIKKHQLLYFWGYGKSESQKWVVYNDPQKDGVVKVVSIDVPDSLRTADYIKSQSDKFGIGWYYYDPVEFGSEEDVKRGMALAEEFEKEQKRKAEKRKKSKDKVVGFITGDELVKRKDNEMFVVISAHYDNSDAMSDYFHPHATIGGTYALAVVKNGKRTKNKILEIINKVEVLSGLKWEWKIEDWAGGNGLYMQSNVIGEVLHNAYDGRKKVAVWLEISYDKWSKELKKSKLFVENKVVGKIENVGDIEIVDYSERAIAVFGDTKPIKDKLKSLGGRFNPYLKKDGVRMAGWVFPKAKFDEVKLALKG